jgi:hypothetical protein
MVKSVVSIPSMLEPAHPARTAVAVAAAAKTASTPNAEVLSDAEKWIMSMPENMIEKEHGEMKYSNLLQTNKK